MSKTELMALGSCKGKILEGFEDCNWVKETTFLGATISNTGKIKIDEKWSDRVENIIQSWSLRKLTLTGKTLLANSLMGSIFVYFMSYTPATNLEIFVKIQKLLLTFVTGGKKSLARIVLLGHRQDGGLGLVDLFLKFQALKLSQLGLPSSQGSFFAMYGTKGPEGRVGKRNLACKFKKARREKFCQKEGLVLEQCS